MSDAPFYFAQFLTGLASASSLFLVASGLSLIFGVTRIVNFAHGSFYMLGAFTAYSLVNALPSGIFGFWSSVFLSALLVGLIGAMFEFVVLRRIYRAPELFQLVATFALVLIIQDAALWIWGAEDLLGPRAPGLDGAIEIFGERIPEYDLALIVAGPAVLLAVWLFLHRSRWGTLIRAATEDREMAGALGVNQSLLFTAVFFLGSFLAGLGGALQVPREAASLLMDLNVIAEAFVVVVIGGMGSIVGAFLAAVLVAELNAFGILVLPKITIVLAFIVMAVVLIVRPWGLLGKPQAGQHGAGEPEQPLRPLAGLPLVAALIVVAALVLAPAIAGDFMLVLLTDFLVAALFAASLHFIMGPGGMISFGHAVFFGLGAYGAALLVKFAGAGMIVALAVAPLCAAAAGVVVGWFCVRLSGVYLAMLTLAVAQIVWSIAFQWQDVTGGDDGIVGVWPAQWAASKAAYYYVALVLCLGGIWLLHRFTHAPFGYGLRAGRDSSLRAESIGINVHAHQWMAFVIAGGLAGVAGSVFVFSKGSIFPDELAIPRSVDGLIMVLLGGIKMLFGPIAGAAAFTFLEDIVTRLSYWRAIFGGLILLIVLAAPDGVAGGFARLTTRWRGKALQAKP